MIDVEKWLHENGYTEKYICGTKKIATIIRDGIIADREEREIDVHDVAEFYPEDEEDKDPQALAKYLFARSELAKAKEEIEKLKKADPLPAMLDEVLQTNDQVCFEKFRDMNTDTPMYKASVLKDEDSEWVQRYGSTAINALEKIGKEEGK